MKVGDKILCKKSIFIYDGVEVFSKGKYYEVLSVKKFYTMVTPQRHYDSGEVITTRYKVYISNNNGFTCDFVVYKKNEWIKKMLEFLPEGVKFDLKTFFYNEKDLRKRKLKRINEKIKNR